MSFLNTKTSALPPSGIRRFFDLVISAGPDVLSLGVGEPDFSAPWHVRESAIFGLEKGFTSYTENAGLLELRQEISEYTRGERYNPQSEILVTNGVSEGMDLAFRATIETGDKILLPDPGYVMYEPLIRLSGGVPVPYFPLDLSTINQKGVRGIVLNFPGNPLGNTFSKEDLQIIAQLARQHNWLIYSDEIYQALTFDGDHLSITNLEGMKERTLLFDGLSKSHAMTGFRVAWVCGPSDLVAGMTKIHQYSALCVNSIAQISAVEALRRGGQEVERMKDIYKSRRDMMVERLDKMGLPLVEPKGAFYLFVKIPQDDDVAFCEEVLKKQRLALVPGSAFGRRGKGHVRMTYAESLETLTEAMDRLEQYLL